MRPKMLATVIEARSLIASKGCIRARDTSFASQLLYGMPVCDPGVPACVIDELETRHGKCVEEGEHGDVATVEPAQYMRHAFGAFELILVGHGHIMRHNYPVHATLH